MAFNPIDHVAPSISPVESDVVVLTVVVGASVVGASVLGLVSTQKPQVFWQSTCL